MALSVNPKIEIINTNDTILIVDVTGDYNAVTNPFGWGSPNESRSSLTAITLSVEYPDKQTTSVTLTGTDFDNDTIRAEELSTLLKQDGVYKYDITFTVSANSETVTYYSLRTKDIGCQLAKLALGNTDTNDFQEALTLYEKLGIVFDCGEYVLAEEVLSDLEQFFDDCGYTKINCGCGC